MKALYLVSSKKKDLSWAKARVTKPEQHHIDLGLGQRIRLFFGCCPNKDLAKMYEKGSEMLDQEFDFMKVILGGRSLKKLLKSLHKSHNYKHGNTGVATKLKTLVEADEAKKLIKIDSDTELDCRSESEASIGPLSPRAAPRSERDILSDNGANENAGKAQEEDV